MTTTQQQASQVRDSGVAGAMICIRLAPRQPDTVSREHLLEKAANRLAMSVERQMLILTGVDVYLPL